MLLNQLSIQGLSAQHENRMTHFDLLNWFMYGYKVNIFPAKLML